MLAAHQQADYAVRFDWGQQGSAAIAADVDVAVIVDVLSFTTTLTVAVDVGVVVLPCGWTGADAEAYARRHDAVLAVPRSQSGASDVSLSPLSLRTDGIPRWVVLPSPNGSTIAHQLGSGAADVVGASLRNATAVSRWIATRVAGPVTVAVIAAGERWPDGGLRPAVEDLWGAGAVLSALVAAGVAGLSPEAEVARSAYEHVAGRERAALGGCASGRELVDRGYLADVEIAAEVDQSDAVPILRHDRFEGARH